MMRLSQAEWDWVVPQARRSDLLARLAALATAQGIIGEIDPRPRAHLLSALTLESAQKDEVGAELADLARILGPLEIPVVLLKGAAYVLAELPAASGRMFSDIDILVPKSALSAVESELMQNGWMTTHHDAYDQRYYREWMHELPPMQHLRRGTVLDVHHALLPETARHHPHTGLLLEASYTVGAYPPLRVLAPVDMVLHSMSHLFHNEEFSHGLRDLSDLDLLLRHFGKRDGFWQELPARAAILDLRRPLHYGLVMAHEVLGTPVPADTLGAVSRFGPSRPMLGLMRALWRRALRPQHHSAKGSLAPLALQCLYVRSHWLRMPPGLLVRHLLYKAWKRRADAWRKQPEEAAVAQ
ncbi:MAG: nucleotidyltransferase family protein [Burkholderiales bacterium]